MRRLLCLLLALWVAVSLSPAFGASKLLTFGSGGIKPLVSYDLTGSNTLPAGISYSATSLRTELDANGFITYAPNEQFLNNASPATQNVTTKASNYVLWCNSTSTGTITLTGTSTAGPLTCTTSGANLAFTPTAGTLTLTIGGTSVTRVVLAQVTYETTLRPQDNVTVTSSAYYGPAFDSNYPSAGYQGLRIEEQRTNLLTQSTALTDVSWSSPSNATGFQGTGVAAVATANYAVSPDGTMDATRIQMNLNGGANAPSATNRSGWVHSISVTLAANQAFIYLKPNDGTNLSSLISSGGLSIGLFAGQTSFSYSVVPLANGWVKVFQTNSVATSTTGTFRIQLLSYTGSVQNTLDVDAWWPQVELGANSTSPIPTGASAVTRSADIVQATGTLAACYKAPSMSAAVQFSYTNPAANKPVIISTTGDVRDMLVNSSGRAALFDTGASPTELDTTTGSTTTGTPTQFADIYKSSGRAIAFAGGNLASDSNTKSAGATVYLGSDLGTSAFIDGPIRKVACWSPALNNNLLQQKSTVSPGPITWLIPANDNFAIFDERRKTA